MELAIIETYKANNMEYRIKAINAKKKAKELIEDPIELSRVCDAIDEAFPVLPVEEDDYEEEEEEEEEEETIVLPKSKWTKKEIEAEKVMEEKKIELSKPPKVEFKEEPKKEPEPKKEFKPKKPIKKPIAEEETDSDTPLTNTTPIITQVLTVPEVVITETKSQSAPVDPNITIKTKQPEDMTNEELLNAYWTKAQNEKRFSNQVIELNKKLKEMEEQMKDFNKYKLFYMKNNGTDTLETQQDVLKTFIESNYEITNNHKDRIKISLIHKEFSKIAQMDIKIFIFKCKSLGLEKFNASGYNVFTCIKQKNANL